MKKSTALLVSLFCLTAMGCRPHPGGRAMRAEGARGGLRQACGSDLEKFCAADQRGRERRLCLQSHADQLSADCKAALAARQHRPRRNRDAE
jgi:hypothetical protein